MCEVFFLRRRSEGCPFVRLGIPGTTPVSYSRFCGCWIDSRIVAQSNKPLRPHLHYAKTKRGWPRPARRWIAISFLIGIGKHPVLEKSSGVQIPLPALTARPCKTDLHVRCAVRSQMTPASWFLDADSIYQVI